MFSWLLIDGIGLKQFMYCYSFRLSFFMITYINTVFYKPCKNITHT